MSLFCCALLCVISSLQSCCRGRETACLVVNPIMVGNFTTAGERDCVAAVERLPALRYSVDFIFLSFGIMGFNVEL